jgi:hypothetical protein
MPEAIFSNVNILGYPVYDFTPRKLSPSPVPEKPTRKKATVSKQRNAGLTANQKTQKKNHNR